MEGDAPKGIEIEIIDEKYRQVTSQEQLCITENATTLKNNIQLITKHTGTPDDVRATFDFVHCKPYYDSLTHKLYISPEQYHLNMEKKLKPTKTKIVQGRIKKFTDRGWTWL